MRNNNAQDLDALLDEIRSEFRTFRLIPKERSRFMWALYYGLGMFLWCPKFMESYTTVVATWVYMPEALIGTPSAYGILRHERVHMRDFFRFGVIPFALSYAFLLPAVLTFRSIWEMRAYKESMRVELEREGYVSNATVEHVARQLTSSSYFWMFPFPKAARRWAVRLRREVLLEAAGKGHEPT